MPTIHIYIKEAVWFKILRKFKYDRRKALEAIRVMVEREYGS